MGLEVVSPCLSVAFALLPFLVITLLLGMSHAHVTSHGQE